MKHMADQQAAPLLMHLNSNPANPGTLGQLGAIYHLAHQYKEAADWYNRAVEAAPNDLGLRTKLAISLYRAGDSDGAITQLNEGLRLNPKDPNCLFNLGMIRLQGKGDAKGALAAWRRLLKSNPDLSPERKLAVQQLIAHPTANRNGMQSQGETLDARQ